MIPIIAYLTFVVINVLMTLKMHKDLKAYWDSNSHMAWIYASCLLSGLSTIPILTCFLIYLDDKREEKQKTAYLSEHQKLANQIMRK